MKLGIMPVQYGGSKINWMARDRSAAGGAMVDKGERFGAEWGGKSTQ